jgi:hypothetical protein
LTIDEVIARREANKKDFMDEAEKYKVMSKGLGRRV